MMRTVEPDDGTATRMLYEAYAARLNGMTFEGFGLMLAGWDVARLVVDGETAGTCVRKQGELHIGVRPEFRGRWATRSFIKAILDWAAESGPVKTGVMHGNEAGKRLVEGVGFVMQETTARGYSYALPG